MTTLPGIDVSAIGQGASFDWTKERGIAFAFIKTSEGLTFADPDYDRNVATARKLGIVVGGYHLIHAADDGAAQAEKFLGLAGVRPGDLVMVDVEEAGYDGRPPEAMAAAVGHFADIIRANTGAWPVTYTNISTAQGGYCATVGMTPLFLANPDRIPMSGVGPWRLISFEQQSQRGTDIDAFYGDLVELRRLTAMHAPPSAAPAPAPAPAPQHAWLFRQSAPTAAPELVSSSDGKTWH